MQGRALDNVSLYELQDRIRRFNFKGSFLRHDVLSISFDVTIGRSMMLKLTPYLGICSY